MNNIKEKILVSGCWGPTTATFLSIPDKILNTTQKNILTFFNILEKYKEKFNNEIDSNFDISFIAQCTGISYISVQRHLHTIPDRIEKINKYLQQFGNGEALEFSITRTFKGNEYYYSYQEPHPAKRQIKIATPTEKEKLSYNEKMIILLTTGISEDRLNQYTKFGIDKIKRNVNYLLQKREVNNIKNEGAYLRSAFMHDWGLSLEDGCIKRDMYAKRLFLLVNYIENCNYDFPKTKHVNNPIEITKFQTEKNLKDYIEKWYKIINPKGAEFINKIFYELRHEHKIFTISQSEASRKNLIRHALMQYYYKLFDFSNLHLLKDVA